MAHLKGSRCSHQGYLILEAHSRPYSPLGTLSQRLPFIWTTVSQATARLMFSIT